WASAMTQIVEHCTSGQQVGQLTPSDVPLVQSKEILSEILGKHLPVMGLTSTDVEDILPATPLQTSFVVAMIKDPSAYTVQQVFRIAGSLDLTEFRRAWADVVAHHNILRTVFVPTSQGVYQIVKKKCAVPWGIDMVWKQEGIEDELRAYLIEDRKLGFNTSHPCLMRLHVVRIRGKDEYRFICTLHHSIVDGWSFPFLIKDVLRAYERHRLEIRPQFKTYVEYISGGNDGATQAFWKGTFEDDVKPAPPLPLAAPETFSSNGYITHTYSSSVEHMAIQTACMDLRITVNTLIRGVWAIVLRHYLRQDDVTFGSVISGRDVDIPGVDRIVGVLINTIPVRVRMKNEQTIGELLNNLQVFHTSSLPFSHVGLADIYKWIGLPLDQALFNTLIVFENHQSVTDITPRQAGIQLSVYEAREEVEHPLTLILAVHNGRLVANVKFDATRFQQEDIVAMMSKFDDVLRSIVTVGAHLPLSELDNIEPAQLERLYSFEQGLNVRIPQNALLHTEFVKRAIENPSTVAVQEGVTSSRAVSYGQLYSGALSLSRRLASNGIGPGKIVVIIVPRSCEMIFAILGVLISGGAYVPVDPAWPTERIQYIVRETACRVVLTVDSELPTIRSLQDLEATVLSLSDAPPDNNSMNNNLSQDPTPDDLAYIIFTSGTTGKPKGVMVSHRGVANVVLGYTEMLQINHRSRVMQMNAISFDVCAWEIFLTLSAGATLFLRNDDNVFATLKTVTHLFITPTGLTRLDPALHTNLRCVTVAGEPCPSQLVERWADSCLGRRFINAYGPTEVSIISHAAEQYEGKRVTIGRPTPNTFSYILDSQLRRVPCGVSGHVYVGGIGVARGYLNNPELTAQKFIPNPYIPGDMLYATGDIGRWTASGEVECLGRSDDQVKVKGYRVELQEVMIAIIEMGATLGVSGAVVLVKNNMLVAFVTPETINVASLRNLAVKRLPAYMVPSVFTALSSLPMNSSGKVDRAKLLEIEFSLQHEEPKSDAEKMLARIWAEVLDIDVSTIGTNHSFFELGGDSFLAVRLASKTYQCGYQLSAAQVFKQPMLSSMALDLKKVDVLPTTQEINEFLISPETLDEIEKESLPGLGINDGDIADIYPATPLQSGLLALTMKDPSAYAVQHIWELNGHLEVDRMQAAITQVVIANPILRTFFIPTRSDGFFQLVVSPSKVEDLLWAGGSGIRVITWQDSNLDEELATFLDQDKKLGFRILEELLLRVKIVRVSSHSATVENKWIMIMTIHHVYFDGWSLPLVIDQIVKSYRGIPPSTGPAFKSYVQAVKRVDPLKTQAYWEEVLSGYVVPPLLRNVNPGTSEATSNQGETCMRFNATLSVDQGALSAATKMNHSTTAVVLNAAWALTLMHYLREDDVVFGNIFSGRELPVPGIEK
ncbi:hypothetical protein HK102_001428, partial [Quaeritorhiza haematococci]